MKRIKIKFIGFGDEFGDGFEETDNLVYNILKKHFTIEISDNPDFVFCSPLYNVPFECARYDCVRIFFTGEPFSVDFNLFDYSIDFDYMTFGDRHIRFPLHLYRKSGFYTHQIRLTKEAAKKILSEKKYFCNFIYGHEAISGMRKRMLETFSKYKPVYSPGRYLNNMPNGKIVSLGPEKLDFVRKCKFTVSVESVFYPGYVGEKISDPFNCHSIPIYYGHPLIGDEFNSKSFVNCHDFESLDAVMKTLVEIDQNDELYLDMLCAEKFNDPMYPEKVYAKLEQFLVNICSQSKEEAYRRTRFYQSQAYERNMRTASYMLESEFVRGINGALYRLKNKNKRL